MLGSIPGSAPIYAVYPNGEGAVLKIVGPKGLAGSNPVYGAKSRWNKYAFNSTISLNVYCMKKQSSFYKWLVSSVG